MCGNRQLERMCPNLSVYNAVCKQMCSSLYIQKFQPQNSHSHAVCATMADTPKQEKMSESGYDVTHCERSCSNSCKRTYHLFIILHSRPRYTLSAIAHRSANIQILIHTVRCTNLERTTQKLPRNTALRKLSTLFRQDLKQVGLAE